MRDLKRKDGSSRCAAAGAVTKPVRTTEHMEQCRECKRAVRFDLVDHSFFGFAANCGKSSGN